jgi:hypothetical protein
MRLHPGILLLLAAAALPLSAQRARFAPQQHELRAEMASAQYFIGQTAAYQNFPSEALRLFRGGTYIYHHSLQDAFRLGLRRQTAFFDRTIFGVAGSESYEFARQAWHLTLAYEHKWVRGAGRAHVFGGLAGAWGEEQVKAGFSGFPPGFPVSSYQLNLPFRGAGLAVGAGWSRFLSPYLSLGIEAEWRGMLNQITEEPSIETYQTELLPGESRASLSVFAAFHAVRLKKRCTCPRH